ncbi:zinc dependent phospholipase C family protein [Peptostreptococcus russellii]|uniref:Zinc dependent phospholipase C n=1 Tax=Peptostreptococcus russellii TaxID=215200 RepID=A0A1H8EMJ7_9FIRM|nr:zinc dependent phospholipase C family protein [Peptostreptococcus russellii]MBC2577516.1 zinc dependent phospholipase C family protein [Peptostreptococcus russellii]SEN20610.1 Zinc dependent phospholipase C [Peptostreptococcus russellii]
MMMKTHIIISKSLLDNIDDNKQFFLNNKSFIYGNIKPDIFSKYKLQKHYLDESYDMVRSKIEYLSNLDLDTLEKYYTKNEFSQEMGVVCHFLADFFCVAHSERWEFKHSLKIHVKYENGLTKVAKDYNLKNDRRQYVDDVDSFFEKLYREYKNNGNFEENDLKYAAYICNTVTNYVLERILDNTIKSHTVA